MRRLFLMMIALLVSGCTAFQRAPSPGSVKPDKPGPVAQAPAGPIEIRVDGASAPVLQTVRFSDLQHGWASGAGITIVTDDGGETWRPGSHPDITPVGAPVTLPDHSQSYCKRDGGRTWQHDNIAFIRQVNDLSFVDARHGWITAGGRILATTDGGRTWRQQYPTGGPGPAQAIAMVDAQTGFGPVAGCVQVLAADGSHSVFSSIDGGATWTPAPAAGGAAACAGGLIGQAWHGTPPPGVIGRWAVLDARIDGSEWVTVEGSNSLWATRDSGKTWQQHTWPQDLGLLAVSVSYVGPGQAWAVTVDGRLLRSASADDGVWQVLR